MKFAHLADCHIGGWREPQLKELTIKSFQHAVDKCIEEAVDFVLVCGDLFDTALPNIELLKETTKTLNKLREQQIPCYLIAGSHDYSPSGKTMLDVLEEAKLVINVAKYSEENKLLFTIDPKTNCKLTGLPGKRTSLEIQDFKNLKKEELEKESGFKIFLFHTSIEEFKPQDLEAVVCTPLSLLPKNFNYYAGGHVHYILEKEELNSKIVYPGPVFPNNFRELEKLKQGSFYIIEKAGETLLTKKKTIPLVEVDSYTFDATNKTPKEVEQEILETITNPYKKIITIRIRGELVEGTPSEIDFKRINTQFSNAHIILKNITKLTTKKSEEIHVEVKDNEDLEANIIREYKEKKGEDEFIIKKLMETLNQEKQEGEKSSDFEFKIIQEGLKVLNLEDDTKKA